MVFFAPITGAWIETAASSGLNINVFFAPITGAWIETKKVAKKGAVLSSHPSRVRGLKQKRA